MDKDKILKDPFKHYAKQVCTLVNACKNPWARGAIIVVGARLEALPTIKEAEQLDARMDDIIIKALS